VGLVSEDVQHVRQQTAAIDPTSFKNRDCVAFTVALSMTDIHAISGQRVLAKQIFTPYAKAPSSDR
jgi:hypothetical protein